MNYSCERTKWNDGALFWFNAFEKGCANDITFGHTRNTETLSVTKEKISS